MEPERWRRVGELFHSALKIAENQRPIFLQDECKDDEELRKEVESLLCYETSASSFIESPAFDVAAQLLAKDKERNAARSAAAGVSPRFHLQEKLGSGGMGVVYKAQDTKLQRSVALKFLPPEFLRDPQALERFQREALTASALNHPNICTVYDVDEYQGQPFISMELLVGQTLDCRIGAQPLPTSELLDVAIQVSEALKAAHSRGIIHRDIKPSNIFVTADGRAKILDFGLAKLQEYEIPRTQDLQQSKLSQEKLEQGYNPNLILTRTGATIGTAGYMSPEQIRGEELDLRTDLFSFGLVLYEMATGRRAFKGDTGPELHNAIIEHVPTPAQQLNPELPAKLVSVINKALRKDRATRYQSAAEIRADLETLHRERELRPRVRPWAVAAGILIVLLIIGTSFWLTRSWPTSSLTVRELKLRQLTVNSFENRVTSGAISPDGKYLAYTDVNGMYVKLTQTGEVRAVPSPKGLNSKNVQWEIGSSFSPAAVWFLDSAGFVANAHQASQDPGARDSEDTSIWFVSASGGAPRKLRDNAVAYAVSPVNSLVLFSTNKGREVWVMGPTGEGARKIHDTPANTPIFVMFWTADGRRIVYAKGDPAGGVAVLSRDLEGGPEVPIPALSEMKNIDDVSSWLPDGRLLYSAREPGSVDTCNYWALRLDPRTGKVTEAPSRLTNWTSFCMSNASVTADGKQLVFLKWVPHMISYMADLTARGTHIVNLRHFPLTESSDGVADWIADSKEVILASNRAGKLGIYKQALNEELAEPLVTEDYGRNPRPTPDGRWILYLGAGANGEPPWTTPAPVMRAPSSGGRSQQVFIAEPMSIIDCAHSPSGPCVIGEPTEDHKQLIVSSLDPLQGRGPELFTFAIDPNTEGWYALSSDGTRIAATRNHAGPIYVLTLHGQKIQQINVKGWSNLLEFTWAADRKGLYVISGTRTEHVLLYVDLQGNAHALWKNTGASNETLAIPSPDGRHLAIQSWVTNGNMWMLEHF
jgi:eukaryotic-like serine/threonine-protein kinase